jgi:hypothetical protein
MLMKSVLIAPSRTIQLGDTSYGDPERLDPGHASSHTLDAEFPAAALKAKTLKEIAPRARVYPVAVRRGDLNSTVSIVGQ